MELIVQLSQFISILILIYVSIANNANYGFMRNKHYQLVFAVIIVSILVWVDPLSGFVLACAAFILYYKIFVDKSQTIMKGDKKKEDGASYITQRQLDSSQTNVYDASNYNKGIGPTQFDGRAVYSIQGFSDEMPGFDPLAERYQAE